MLLVSCSEIDCSRARKKKAVRCNKEPEDTFSNLPSECNITGISWGPYLKVQNSEFGQICNILNQASLQCCARNVHAAAGQHKPFDAPLLAGHAEVIAERRAGGVVLHWGPRAGSVVPPLRRVGGVPKRAIRCSTWVHARVPGVQAASRVTHCLLEGPQSSHCSTTGARS